MSIRLLFRALPALLIATTLSINPPSALAKGKSYLVTAPDGIKLAVQE
ncbi:MAG: alpha/beta hydrolase, partial [Alphaproteobacteria bacterium]